MAYEGLIVHGPPASVGAPLASLEQWIPGGLRPMDEEQAIRELVRRYFGAYGPATVQDLATWSGIPMGLLRPARQAVRGSLVEFAMAGQATKLLSDRRDESALQRGLPVEAAPRFLPRYDNILLGFRDRSRFVDPRHQRFVVSRTGQMEATFLIDGRVAGTWGSKRRGTELIITLRPFRGISTGGLKGLRREAELLSEFYGAKQSSVKVGERW